MLTIYGNPASTCTRKVLTTLAETNQPYELVVVDMAKGEHKSAAHVARQPFGQVPAIDDDGFTMFESRAIARYLDSKAGGVLTPKDPKQRAKMEQWMAVEVEDFAPHAMKFVYEHMFKRAQPPEVMENATKRLELVLGVLDANLADKKFLVGDQFTLADVTFAPYFEYAMATPAKAIVEKYPHVAAWWGRVRDRSSWKQVTGRA